ncbi:transposase [Pseudomonas sp. NPDC098747]|uniref:IS66 family transposase n=1 Tax=Pseudomonas sp. NPDC098747 TaxID=3364487 RepID=UPI003839DEF3
MPTLSTAMKPRCRYLKEPGKSAQSKSYLWAQMNGSGPPVRLFTYSPTRNTAKAQVLYAGIMPGSVLMSDGYAPYETIASLLACSSWLLGARPTLHDRG